MTNFYRLPSAVDGALANGAINDRLALPDPLYYPISGATDEWRFRRGKYSLVGCVAKGLLTPNNDVPTYDNFGMQIAAGTNQGLLSGIDEAVAETCIYVSKMSNAATANELYGGTATTTTTNGGDLVYRMAASPTVIRVLTRGYGAASGVGFISSIDCAAIPPGVGVVIVVSYSSTGRVVYIGGVGSAVLTGRTDRAVSSPARKRSVGNVYYNYNFPGAPKLFGYIPAWKNLAECTAIADNVRTMQARIYGNRIF